MILAVSEAPVCGRPPRGLRAAHRCAVAIGAALVLLASQAGAAGPAISDEARARFSAGVTLLTDPEGPRYEEAYREFKAAYAMSPSYKMLGNLGLCAMKLERDDEAIEAYEKYLTQGSDLSPAEAQQIKTDLNTLKTVVAHMTVDSDPPGARIFDARVPSRGERILTTYGPLEKATRLGLHQGTHELTAKLEGYPDQIWNVDASGGQEIPEHKFVFTKDALVAPPSAAAPAPAPAAPASVSKRPLSGGVWAGVAITGALAVATGITGALALGKHSDFVTANDGTNPTNAQSIKSSGQTLNLVTDVCLGAAVIGAVVTTVLFVGRPTVESPAAATADERTKLAVVPTIGRGAGGLSLQGSF